MAQAVKGQPTMQEACVWFLTQEDLLQKEKTTHSNILAWRIPWTEAPGGLQSMGSQRAGHDRVTKTHTHPTAETNMPPYFDFIIFILIIKTTYLKVIALFRLKCYYLSQTLKRHIP